MKQRSILFVCTGNTFRSMIAECAFKKYLADNKITGWKISSAGTIAKKARIDPKTIEAMEQQGVNCINHKQKKLTEEMLKKYDIIIAMGKGHKRFMDSKMGCGRSMLFNELAINKKTSVMDINEEVKDFGINRRAVEDKIGRTVKEIFRKTPWLFKNASERYYLFCDLVAGLRTQRKGFPFIKIYETKNSVSFMSLDIPLHEDGHILVIPKRRYLDLSEVPTNIMKEISESIQVIGTILMENHGGYNILLNNGVDAGQYIFHAHFHIIPRTYNDQIKIENWRHKNISRKEFISLSKRLRRRITAQSLI